MLEALPMGGPVRARGIPHSLYEFRPTGKPRAE
jgi:hypothetical protein